MPETTHPPAGDFPKSANVRHLDLEAEADELIGKLPGNRRQTRALARAFGVSVILMAMEAGDTIEEHSAAGVVTVQLVRGHTRLSADGQAIDLRPGQLVMFQPGLRHGVRAEEQSVVLLTITGGDA